MGFDGGAAIAGTPIDVAFVGSCTNGRLSDLREAARVVAGHHVAPGVRALVVPGSERVRRAAEREGLHEIFQAAGFEWRGAGCSMCLAMNPDRLEGREICASSSNRNFKGRQGSPTGRTLLMSPGDGRRGGNRRRGRRRAAGAVRRGGARMSRISTASRAARCRCAATTSTRIASSPRGSSRRVASKGLERHVFADDRSRRRQHPFDDPALRGRARADREPQLRLRLVARARAAGAAALGHPGRRRRIATRRSSSATPCSSGCPASPLRRHAIEQLMARSSGPADELTVDLETMTVAGGRRCGSRRRCPRPRATR